MARYGWIGLAVSFVLSWTCCTCLWGRPTTAQEAEKVVVGWLKADPKPLGMPLGRHVRKVETFTGAGGGAVYYIVYLQPSGFVIVPAEDLVEPIIGFVQGDRFDPSPGNPLGALVADDLTRRMAAVRRGSGVRIMADESFERDTQTKWRHLIELAEGPQDGVAATASGIPSTSDVRVAPLVKSKWWQCTVSSCGSVTVGKDCPLPCYNYYTPGNYPCGCPATSLAQLVRYHEYPTTGIGVHKFTITVDSVGREASTRGGDGSGGPYNWDLMPYEPNCTTTEAERQVIGALCYDAGVSMNQLYTASGSGYPGCGNARIKEALTTTFGYGNAVHGYNAESPIGRGLIGMINPNLDAKKPVVLGTAPHAFVCDGYGYSDSTLYHHLNMGWSGLYDVWYDLTSRITAPPDLDQGIVCSCVYNVQTLRAADGEIISGRVLDENGEPIANAVVYAKSGSEIRGETETDTEGIYAFDYLQSNTTYTVNAALKGYGFNRQKITTGTSKDNSIVSGNAWGVDFVGLLGDFNGDQIVDMRDLSMLAQYWGQSESSVDIAPEPFGDHTVDYNDLAVFAAHWLKEAPLPPEPGLIAHWKLDETAGTIAHDSTNGHNDATVMGNADWKPAGGKLGGALQLTGVGNFVTTKLVRDPSTGPFSVSAWVKGGGPGQVILSQTGGANWLMASSPDGMLMTDLKSAGRQARASTSTSIITDGAWHRVGLVWDGTNRILYLDDVEVAKDTQANLPSSTGALYIGAGSKLAAGSFWSGLIDDVRIYDRTVKP